MRIVCCSSCSRPAGGGARGLGRSLACAVCAAVPARAPVNPLFFDNMAGYHIRLYKDSDYKTVRVLFANGQREHIPVLRQYIWKLPRTTLLALSVLLVLFVSHKYFYMSVIEVTFCLAAATSGLFALVWFGAYYPFERYLQQYLKEDMFDIQHYYIQRKGACFWVAECNGEVVGMVAAEPYSDTNSGTKVELKRLCVNDAFRGLGIGKALCQTVINFARQEGCQSVILETTNPQYASQQLYTNLGFRKIHCFVPARLICRLFHCQVLIYRYDL